MRKLLLKRVLVIALLFLVPGSGISQTIANSVRELKGTYVRPEVIKSVYAGKTKSVVLLWLEAGLGAQFKGNMDLAVHHFELYYHITLLDTLLTTCPHFHEEFTKRMFRNEHKVEMALDPIVWTGIEPS